MASALNMQWCDPCGRDGENQKAHSWCSDCSEPLCGECLKFHRKGKTTANHKTIPILEAEKLSSSVLNIPETCHNHHDQKLSLYCLHHDTICCAFCLRESHNTCKDVESIENASKGVKMGTAIDDLQRRFSNFSLIVSKIVEIYRNNLSLISQRKEEMKESFRNVRKDINIYLDEQERVMHTNLADCDRECKDEIEKNITNLTARKNKSDSWKTVIETLTEHASETSIFAAIKTIDLLQVEEETCLSKFQESFVAYELRSPQSDFIEKIQPILARLSVVKIEKTQTTVQLPTKVQQVHTYKMQKEKPRIVMKISCSKLNIHAFNRACLTIDTRIVFCGRPISVYNMCSSKVCKMKIEFSPTDITCDFKNNVFASFPRIGVFSIDINSLTKGPRINKLMDKSSQYQCVKLHNDLIYLAIKDVVAIFNEEGNVVKALKCKLTPIFMCVEELGGIFIADGKSIIHLPETGSHNEIPTNMKTNEYITGLDVDKQGQLYACINNDGDEVGSIFRIHATSGYREPVLEKLVTPCNIAFHPTNDMFLVMSDHGKECSVYEFTK